MDISAWQQDSGEALTEIKGPHSSHGKPKLGLLVVSDRSIWSWDQMPQKAKRGNVAPTLH